jgi:hypothetical protein
MVNGDTTQRLLLWWGNVVALIAAMAVGAIGAYWIWP